MDARELLAKYYPGGAPLIIQVAFDNGYGPAIIELNKKVYFNDELSFSPAILEAIQCLCLSSCENKYCAIMHARGMITQGFTLEDVQQLVELQRLPEFVAEREKWESSLRRIATLFRQPKVAPFLSKSLEEFHTPEEIEDIAAVVAFSLLHKFLLEFYSEEMDIEREPILFATVDCGSELIQYYTAGVEAGQPLFTLCCMCKDVKGHHGWIPIEQAMEGLPQGTRFSHGICQRCVERWKGL